MIQFKSFPSPTSIRTIVINLFSNNSLRSSALDADVCLLDLLTTSHPLEPFFNVRVFVQRKASKGVLSNPRLEMVINGCHLAWQNALSGCLFEMLLKDIEAPIALGNISSQGILILGRIVVTTSLSVVLSSSEWTDTYRNQFV